MAAGPLHTANLIFERKIKGHFPVTRLAVSDSGAAMVVIPDDHQPRLYHLISFAAAEEWREVGSFSVEKLQQIDLAEGARVFVATTDDDVYVFRDNTKKRLFPDRRDIYASISVASAGEHFAIGSADMILSSHSVTLAKTSGGQVWVKDLPFSATSVCISDDATRILVGSDEGYAVMLDNLRSTVWQLEGNDSITALATSQDGDTSVVGTRRGCVYVIGGVGNKLWDVARDGRIVDCAISRDGRLIAIARETPLDVGVVEFFCNDGTPVLEHGLTSHVMSVACSPNGEYTAISCEDGVLQILEITSAPGRSCTAVKSKSLREEAFAAASHGEHAESVEKLTQYLKLCPSDVKACIRLAEESMALVEQRLLNAERFAAEDDHAQAVKELQSACELLPYDRQVFERISAIRERLISDALTHALTLAEQGQLEEAAAKIEETIALDHTNCHAREVLSKLENDLVAKYLADAESASGEGRWADAVRTLEKAIAIQPLSAVQERLSHARAGRALEEGLALYEAKKFSQAVFQFRKVLSIDPDNAEAQKYIEYAENLRQNDMLFDRFSKLE